MISPSCTPPTPLLAAPPSPLVEKAPLQLLQPSSSVSIAPPPLPPICKDPPPMSWRQSSVHMERALLERCPNTLLRRRVSEAGLKVQPRILSELSLPSRGLRPLATSATTPASRVAATAAAAAPRYTSLAEIIPTECASVVESVSSPRTPMRNRLVEKAVRAYLLPSDSFNNNNKHSPRHSSSSRGTTSTPWTHSFSRFLPRLSVLTMALNPFNAFSSAFQVFRFYVTGARAALQPQLVSGRSVLRSFSMPVQRMSYAHELSLR